MVDVQWLHAKHFVAYPSFVIASLLQEVSFCQHFLLFDNPFWLGQSPSHQPRIPASKSLLFVSQLNSPMVDTCQKSGNSHGVFRTHRYDYCY
jgi:hypothetical protein